MVIHLTREIVTREAGIVIRVVECPDKVLVSRVEGNNVQLIYEEYKLPDGQWASRTNPLADFPPRHKSKTKTRSTCDFCDKPLPDSNRPDLLADEGWTPSYWIPSIEPDIQESECHYPVCGECSDKFLEFDTENGDMQVKLEYLPMVLCSNTTWSIKEILKAVIIDRERYHGTYTILVM